MDFTKVNSKATFSDLAILKLVATFVDCQSPFKEDTIGYRLLLFSSLAKSTSNFHSLADILILESEFSYMPHVAHLFNLSWKKWFWLQRTLLMFFLSLSMQIKYFYWAFVSKRILMLNVVLTALAKFAISVWQRSSWKIFLLQFFPLQTRFNQALSTVTTQMQSVTFTSV